MRPIYFLGYTISTLGAAPLLQKESKGHQWQPASTTDSRSPCPGLNALAKHGFLPHDGKNIDAATFRYAMNAGFNFEPHILDDVIEAALTSNISTTGNASRIHLADLAAHNVIEFDGSLWRNDFYFGDDLQFDPKIWGTLARNLDLYNLRSDKYVRTEVAAKTRAAQVIDAKAVNPNFTDSGLSSPDIGAPKEWVRPFFEEERIPYCEGFQMPEILRTLDLLTNRTLAVAAVPI
ncbi:putative Heme haloperoxidase family profile domain-containing protein [Seiridium unicorne]|uniref:Heme haloperoxidase family profile domain-containing protein n=1 Tax=Seiridium unicorne TaxID=138068 RepID=A0ABR2V8I4_9PEZI